jgi:hypothetical protein
LASIFRFHLFFHPRLVHCSPSGSSQAFRLGWHPCPVAAASRPRRLSERRVVTAVVAPSVFYRLSASGAVLPLALLLVSSALRSLRLSPAFFATMASADSLPALTGKVSPGKVTGLSAHAAGLYPPRFFDSLRTSRSLARSSPVAGLSVRSSSCGRAFAFRCFHPDGGTCGSATVVAIDPDELLSFHKSSPMLGTLGRHNMTASNARMLCGPIEISLRLNAALDRSVKTYDSFEEKMREVKPPGKRDKTRQDV